MEQEYILKMNHISKDFPGVKALDDVSFNVKKGTVHALMGENGAGKSTLMKILYGMFEKDAGEIIFDGEKVEINKPHDALESGISMIFQELSPVLHMNVAENIYLGREPKKGPLVDKEKLYEDAKNVLALMGIDNIDPNERMFRLSVAKMQMCEICKALSNNSKLIIMDEPTSALTEEESNALFKTVSTLRKQGVSFVFVTHKIDEVFEISDEITILRDGQYIGTKSTKDITKEEMISMMVGRNLTQLFPKEEVEIGDVMFSVRGLTINGVFEDISFDVHKGEILGVAGLMGAGRTEIMEAIFGFRKVDSGEIHINGEKVNIRSPKDAIKHRISLLTEDRKLTGLFLNRDVADNLFITSLNDFTKGPLLSRKKIRDKSNVNIEKFRIKTPNPYQMVESLSGGNQQKVLVSRALEVDPEIIIFDEPTRGIDVGAKAEIHALLVSMAKQGKCVIMVSSELPEIMGMSDRILVICNGKQTGMIDREEATQQNIMHCATM